MWSHWFGRRHGKGCAAGDLIVLMLQCRADIWRHFGCLGELLQIDKQNVLKFSSSHFTSPGDCSHSEAGWRNSTEWWGTACTTNIWISSHFCNEYLCAVWGLVACTPSYWHTHRLHHRAAFALNNSWPFTEATDFWSIHPHTHTDLYLWSHFNPWPF